MKKNCLAILVLLSLGTMSFAQESTDVASDQSLAPTTELSDATATENSILQEVDTASATASDGQAVEMTQEPTPLDGEKVVLENSIQAHSAVESNTVSNVQNSNGFIPSELNRIEPAIGNQLPCSPGVNYPMPCYQQGHIVLNRPVNHHVVVRPVAVTHYTVYNCNYQPTWCAPRVGFRSRFIRAFR